MAASRSDVFSLESRTLRSLLHLAFRPGAPTAAYFSGKRVRYTQPLQLYLIAAAVFFLANSFHPFLAITDRNQIVSAVGSIRMGTELSAEQLGALQRAGVSLPVFRERFQAAVSQTLPPFMIGSVLAFALALAAFNPRRPALVHIVFALHWTGFYLLVTALERLVPGAPGESSPLAPVITVLALLHLIIALRTVYARRWSRAVLSGLALMLIFQALLALWVNTVVEYSLRRVL